VPRIEAAKGVVPVTTAGVGLRWEPKLLLEKAYDIVVCGGGPAGVAAALAACQAGARVLLVEGQGQLGGMGTSGLVSHWLGGRTLDGHWVVGGLFRIMATEAAGRGLALLPRRLAGQKYTPHGWYMGLVHGVPFDPFAMATYLDEKVTSAGVDVLLCTQALDLVITGDRITHVVISNKSGLAAVPALAVVDATGDADMAARGGCEVVKGRAEDGQTTPVTLQFHVDNVDQEALAAHIAATNEPRFRRLITRLRMQGEWPFPYDIFISVQLHEQGTMMINTSRICGVDGTDGGSVTEGMMKGRAETQKLLELMRRHIPGFSAARLKAVAPLLGVRETRRVIGDFCLSVDDVTAGRLFPDTVGLSSYGWDLPDPAQPSYQPMSERRVHKPPFTPIPYRVMVPRPLANLICPGRAVSVERDVLGPLRVMAPCMAMGEAAGLAAKQVVERGVAFREVDVKHLQARLRARGCILDPGEVLHQVVSSPQRERTHGREHSG
jgi:hypothetical protein